VAAGTQSDGVRTCSAKAAGFLETKNRCGVEFSMAGDLDDDCRRVDRKLIAASTSDDENVAD
jgi:hypothetical protein